MSFFGGKFMTNNVTIKDVAKYANVSIATVSRVLNGVANVDESLKEKVLKAIDELNFKPNQLARALKNDVTNTIGVVVSDISNPFFINVAREIERQISVHGYMMLMVSTDGSPQKELQYMSVMQEKRMDGLIISPDISTQKHLDSIKKIGCPTVCIDRKALSTVYDSVYVDKVRSAYDLSDYLIKKGHTRIALVTGPKELSSNYDRYYGYVKASYDNNIGIDNDLVLCGSFNEEWGHESLKKLFNMDNKPTAIISGSVSITNGILCEAKEMKIKIPDDVSLVSFGEISMQKIIEPKVTFTQSMISEIGFIAGSMIIARINNTSLPIHEEVLTANIIEGNSVKNLNSSK